MTTLDFNHVTKIYNVRGAGQIKALDDVSFHLESHQITKINGQRPREVWAYKSDTTHLDTTDQEGHRA